jgi:iron complex outermembrane receptor protein
MKLAAVCATTLAAIVGAPFRPGFAQSLESLGQMSIEELGNVEITSVSKRPEALADAPAAIYVLNHDDIMRSGATSIPEMLRLAPNLQVAEISPSDYVITARGFSGNTADQSFSNKLLVLIDGRSVYTPLYSGVYWDAQDLLPDDIERIEVISGPGATLWGANAVNGVINITTRNSSATPGGLLEIGGGNQEVSTALRFGGQLTDDMSYRVYAKAFNMMPDDTPGEGSAHDGWSKPQGGFRLDWKPGGDLVTFQGDLYAGAEEQLQSSDQLISGGNLEASWHHTLDDGSNLQLLTYYDQTRRSSSDGGGSFVLRTYDIEVEHSFTLADWNKIVWGVGERVNAYRTAGAISPFSSLVFTPAERTLNLADLFAEDTMTLTNSLQLTAGLKLEDDPYSGLTPMPSIRISWKPWDEALLWAAASRAVRAPTPFDVDVVEKIGTSPYLYGDPDFRPETMEAFELGYRQQITPALSLSVSGFDNIYNQLRNIVSGPDDSPPYRWGNGIEGDVYGVEAWAAWQATGWWRLNAGLNFQHESLRFNPGASTLAGVAQAGDDPHHQVSLRSSMNLGREVTFDADFRYVGALPDPYVPGYAELNLKFGWRITDSVELAISGLNLLHDKHIEYTEDAPSDLIKRSFFIDTRWKF